MCPWDYNDLISWIMKLKDLPAAFLLCTYKWGTEMKHSFQVIIYFLIYCYFNWLRDFHYCSVLFFGRVFDLCLLENNVRHLAHVILDPPFSCRGTEKEENMVKHPDYIEENEDDQKMIRSYFKNFFVNILQVFNT